VINKKNVLGKTPEELGDKDAIHVAIVAVRANRAIEPGAKCSLNADREAIPDHKGIGVADPFRKKTILRGETFWLLMAQDSIPNVQHHWEHPTIDFSPPTVPAQKNRYIQMAADAYGVTYEQIMEAATSVVENRKSADYPATGTKEDLDAVEEEEFERYDFWSSWSDETLYEFENYGSACCPEYQYPEISLFKKV